MQPPDDPFVPYRPTSTRRRAVIAALAVAMALAVMAMLLTPHLRFMQAQPTRAAPDAAGCAGGQRAGCVGGTMGVIAAPPASAPR